MLRDSDGQVIGGAEVFRDLSEIEALRQQLAGKSRVGDLVSRSPLMQRLFEVLPAIAASPSTVLVLGATGTGKEVMARTIHSLSARSRGPFVAVNCAALPETLLESELFGYKAGAFTDARTDKPGRFALAASGTIFLDEIGEMNPALQVKLLRVLQERVVRPVGATQSEKVDVRFISATHRDLEAAMQHGEFREDLYYRLDVVSLTLPRLEERREDIPLLATHFLRQLATKYARPFTGFAPEALEALVGPESDLVGRALKDLSFPKGVLVLCIMRADTVLIPGGHDVIQRGDRLFILSLTESIPEVERMLSRGQA